MSLPPAPFAPFHYTVLRFGLFSLSLAAFTLPAVCAFAAPAAQTEIQSHNGKTRRPASKRRAAAVQAQLFHYRPPALVKIDFTASPLQQMLRGGRPPLTAKSPNWLNRAPAAASGGFMCGQLAASVFARTEVFAEADIAEAAAVFYQNHPQFLWLDADGKLRPQARQIMEIFAKSAQDGLNPADYSLPALPAAQADAAQKQAEAAQFELSLTARLLRYVSDIERGRVPPSAFKKNYDLPAKETDFGAVLALLGNSDAPQKLLDAIRPQADIYAALQTELADLREQNSPDNAAGHAHAQAIEHSLERLRWLPRDFPHSYILVNIPAFSAQFFNNHREKLNMRAVVGTKRSPTMIFTSQIERVVFNPSWGVPYSIIKNEMAGKIAKDPFYPARHNYEIYRNGRKVSPASINWAEALRTGNIHIRQKPGANNALGRLKILFPNAHNIYMHDTPGQSAFARENRALSHGCVRLAQPEAMAAAVLGKEKSELAPYFKRQENGIIPAQNISVYLAYFTAWPQAQNGEIRYYADIYGLDAPLAEAEAAVSKARAEGNARPNLKPEEEKTLKSEEEKTAQTGRSTAMQSDVTAALPSEKEHGG